MHNGVRKTVVLTGKEWLTNPHQVLICLLRQRDVGTYAAVDKQVVTTYGVERKLLQPFEVVHVAMEPDDKVFGSAISVPLTEVFSIHVHAIDAQLLVITTKHSYAFEAMATRVLLQVSNELDNLLVTFRLRCPVNEVTEEDKLNTLIGVLLDKSFELGVAAVDIANGNYFVSTRGRDFSHKFRQ